MKKQILWLSLLLCHCFMAIAQSTLISDNTEAKWSLSVIDRQAYIRGEGNPFNENFTGPTIIHSEKNAKGELYVKLFINADRVQILSGLVHNRNLKRYEFFMKQVLTGNTSKGIELPMNKYTMDELLENGRKLGFVTEGETDEAQTIIYTVKEKATGKVLPSLTVEYVFPNPSPYFVSIDSGLIEVVDSRIGDDLWFDSATVQLSAQQLSEANLAGKNDTSHTMLILPPDKNSMLIAFNRLRSLDNGEYYLEYKLEGKDKGWRSTAKKAMPCVLLKNLPVGKYKLLVRYPLEENHVFEMEFEIKQRLTDTTFFKVLTGSVITALICFVAFFFRNKIQKRKLEKERLVNQLQVAEMNGVRTQLNPHFIFNALSSIQGLMNNGNTAKANQYLSDFSLLLRQTLQQHNQPMVPLATELTMLESYIKIEKLRFGFSYEVIINTSTSSNDIEIPSLLAQPIIENAIKHGISGQGNNGRLIVLIQTEKQRLDIVIKDSGPGLDLNWKEGYGLKLTRERIQLLNRQLKGQFINLRIKGMEDGFNTIALHFENWLA